MTSLPVDLQFTDGDWRLNGPDSLCEALHQDPDTSVQLLAFAPDGGWYVLWEDGTQAWEGLPMRFHNILNGRQKSLPGVEQLAVGPNGEWFVRFLNGSVRMAVQTTSCAATIEELQQAGHSILSVLFGEDWSWCVQYA